MINIRKLMPLCLSSALVLVSINVYAGDIKFTNNATVSGTAKIGGRCSSDAPLGSKGVLQPNTSVTAPQFVLNMICPKTCAIEVYMNDKCSGASSAATFMMDNKNGVQDVVVHDDHFKVTRNSNFDVVVTGSPGKKWYEFFTGIFS